MKITSKVLLALFSVALLPMAANASHIGTMGSIDDIDCVIGSGGGTCNGSVAGADDDWIVFNATAGDNIYIEMDLDNWFLNAVLLTDANDGNFAIGDTLGVSNFNSSRVGAGVELQILAHIGSNEFRAGSPVSNRSLNWVAGYTGQYGIGIKSANDSRAVNWTALVRGNTFTASVPEPGTLALLGLGLAGLAVQRKKIV